MPASAIAPISPKILEGRRVASALDGAVVVMATEVVSVGALAPRVTGEPAEQPGKLVAPEGLDVTAQVSVTIPAYPLAPVTVTLEVPDAPRATEMFDAESE